ncbi:hypothetical protein A3Q56_01162, partial [Intoshia linei]
MINQYRDNDTVIERHEMESFDKVELANVPVLTFSKGMYTSGRRSKPLSQLKCISGACETRFMPHSVQCYNRGASYNDIN